MDINTLNDQLDYLAATKSLMKDTLNAKGQNIKTTDTFRSYVSKIDNLTNTTDGNATSTDMALNKVAYANGQKVIGSLPVIDTFTNQDVSVDSVTAKVSGVEVRLANDTKRIITTSGGLKYDVPNGTMAEALGLTASKLVSGNTILGVSGNNANVNTADANATANDIVGGKTAYVNGSKITGSMILVDDKVVSQEDIANGNIGVSTNATGLNMTQTFDLAKISSGYIRGGEQSITIPNTIMSNALSLTSSKLSSGTTLFGVSGKSSIVDTETNTPITASDVKTGLVGYVNGAPVTGNLNEYANEYKAATYSGTETFASSLAFYGIISNPGIYRNTAGTFVSVGNSTLATTIGLSAGILKKDETILGITGTYEGLMTAEDYATCNSLLDTILGTSE